MYKELRVNEATTPGKAAIFENVHVEGNSNT